VYKEKYQQSERDQIDPREVYIRGMNRDQRKDRFDTNKEVLGMTPSQALDNYFKDLRADPVNGDKFIKGLEAWWCKSELGGAKNENQDIKIIKSWLKPVVEKVLTDNDRQKYLRGEESDIDWSDEKNMRKYYGLVAEMERKWQGVSLLGARSAQVNLNNLNKSEIEYAEWINKMGETFGEIGDALAGFTMEASRVSMKMAKVGVPTIR